MSWTALEMEHMLHETNDREACRQCDQRSVRGRLKNKKASFVDLILISHHYYHFVIQMSFTVTDHHHSSTLSLSTYVFHNSFPPKTVFVSPDWLHGLSTVCDISSANHCSATVSLMQQQSLLVVVTLAILHCELNCEKSCYISYHHDSNLLPQFSWRNLNVELYDFIAKLFNSKATENLLIPHIVKNNIQQRSSKT